MFISFFRTVFAVILLFVTGCSFGEETSECRFFNKGTINLFEKDSNYKSGETDIGINSYLWQASLDTVSFMPIANANPFGGVIITDWYSLDGIDDEKFKVNIYVVSKSLKSDGVEVEIFRKMKNFKYEWVDAKVQSKTVLAIKKSILKKAHKYKIQDEISK